jgi:hypothetical protein
MIPRIAYFHWDGQPMCWLRTVALASFAKFNPAWEMRLVRTKPDMRRPTLRFMHYADWTWWRELAAGGGFQVATDIVFLKPMPEEWLDQPIAACVGDNGRIFQFAALGAVQGHPMMVRANERCMEIADQAVDAMPTFQSMGVCLLQELHPLIGPYYDIPMSAFCHVDSENVERLWALEDVALPEEAVGVHWYGGHERSRLMEPYAGPNGNTFIERLAQRVFP